MLSTCSSSTPQNVYFFTDGDLLFEIHNILHFDGLNFICHWFCQFCSWPTVLQLWGVSHSMSNWFVSYQPQRTQISTIAKVPFIQNSNQMASSVDQNRKFFKHILSTPTIFKATSKLSACKAALMSKTDLIFPAFSLGFVDFAVQFCFRCKFSIHEKPFESILTVAWFFWTNHNSLLCISNQ